MLASIKVAANYFGSQSWGIYVTSFAIITLLVAVEDFGLQTIVAREISLKQNLKNKIFKSSLFLRILLSVGAIALTLTAGYIMYPHKRIVFVIALLSCPILTADAIQSSCFSVFQADEKIGKVGLVEFIGAALSFMSSITVSQWHLTLHIFALMQSGSALIAGIVALLMLKGNSQSDQSEQLNTKVSWRHLIKTTTPFGIVILVNTAYIQIDTILLSLFKDSTMVAWYGLSALIAQFVMSATSFLMSGLLPKLSTETIDNVFKILQKVCNFLFALGVITVIGSLAVSRSLILTIMSTQFLGSVNPLKILIFGVFVSSQYAIYGNSLVARGKEKSLIKVGLSVLFINVIFNLILIPTYGAIGSAAAIIVSETVSATLTTLYFYKYFKKVFIPENYLRVILAGCGSVVVWLVLVKLNYLPARPILNCITLGLAILGTYLIILFYRPLFKAIKTTSRNTQS